MCCNQYVTSAAVGRFCELQWVAVSCSQYVISSAASGFARQRGGMSGKEGCIWRDGERVFVCVCVCEREREREGEREREMSQKRV